MRWTVVVTTLLAVGCAGDEAERFDSEEGLGTEAWNAEITCDSDAQCLEGETCEDGVCQMKRCFEDYASAAPLGSFRYLGVDGEIALVGDKTWIDAFEANGDYLGSLDVSAQGTVVDVAGGNLNGERPQGVAMAIEGKKYVVLDQSDGVSQLDIGFVPRDVGAGDVDGDGLDELVAFGADGSIAVCNVDVRQCQQAKIDGIVGRDVTVGDVDADGRAEPVFLYNVGDEEHLMVWNLDAEATGQDESRAWSLSFDAKEIDAGDPFGLGYDVVVIKHESGYFDIKDDKLQIFSVVDEQIIASPSIHGHTIDVALGDRDGDDRDEIVTLRNDHHYEVYQANDDLTLTRTHDVSIPVGASATRLSVVDYDGDSPAGRLMQGPQLVAGKPVPVALMLFPPYPHAAAEGALSASVMIGQSETQDETFSDSMSLHLGMTASFGLDAGPFKAKVSATLSKDWTTTQSISSNVTVGGRYTAHAEPEIYGRNYAAVILSCGCYHSYRYETDDPAGKLGGSGKLAELMVPVGGQTQLWSSKRYNQLAALLGTMPIIEVPFRVGDPSSYPTAPQSIFGATIADEDMLFPSPPSFQLSDVGYVGFWMSAGETETNQIAETTTVGMSAGFGVFGAGLDVDTSIGVTQGYSISVGREAVFSGSVPPVPDNPATPEDDYLEHRFSFTPYVYREHYLDAGGADSGYYVLSYYRSE